MDNIYVKNLDCECRLELAEFLRTVNCDFPIPLSQKVNIDELARKLTEFGVCYAVLRSDEIVAGCFGYANDSENKTAYISVVATLKDFRGNGYAQKCVMTFLEEAKRLGMESVFLYTHSTNYGAIRLYEKLGFIETPSDRENDVKLMINL